MRRMQRSMVWSHFVEKCISLREVVGNRGRKSNAMRRASEGKPNKLLKRERELRGWSQADVAEKIGGDPKTVGRWERGITSPGPQLCQKLCELFGKNTEELGLLLDHPDLLTPPTFPCVFLASSYADAEHRLVLSLKTDLQARGVTVWS